MLLFGIYVLQYGPDCSCECSILMFPSILNGIPRKLEVWTSVFGRVSFCKSDQDIAFYPPFASPCLFFFLFYLAML